jgi:hypothetical protein
MDDKETQDHAQGHDHPVQVHKDQEPFQVQAHEALQDPKANQVNHHRGRDQGGG